MKFKIFVIEDVPEMADLIALYLNKNEMEACVFSTAESALQELQRGTETQAILLDLNLPGMSGFEFLKKFREQFQSTIPVIIISARNSDEDIIKALDLGGDEFVTKPFSPKVLVAKLNANLRRINKTLAAENSIQFDDYTLFENSGVLKNGAAKIPLSAKEFDVLEFLVRNAGKNLSPEKIYNEVWKSNFGDLTAVAVYIQRLRKKIEKNPSDPKYIKTIFGYGYRFELPQKKS